MAWYNSAWSYALPVSITNGSTTSALSYAQVAIPLTGAAYTSFHAHAKADGSDIVVTDSDGVTTLPFALEGIDTTNSAVYLLAKVSLPANTAKTIYVYYGNAAATSLSNYSGAITPQVAISGPTDLVTQSPNAGYHSNAKLIRLQHQTGVSASRNGDLLAFFYYRGSTNGGPDAHIGMLRCPNGSDPAVVGNWTLTDLLVPVTGSGVPVEAAGELPNGTIFIIYESATNAVLNTAKGAFYCGKSTDGGQTWTNVSTAATNPMPVVSGATSGTNVAMWWGQLWTDSAGNAYMSYYGTIAAETVNGAYLFKLAAGADPSVGSNWTQFATIAYDSGHQIAYNEPNILETSPGTGNLLCVLRNDGASPNTGDLYVTRSTNGGTTWSAPTALGLPLATTSSGSSSATSPWLLRLASGNILLHFGNRNVNSLDPAVGAHSIYGDLALLSTDGGTSFFDRYFAAPSQFDNGGNNTSRVDFGVGSSVQLPDGRIVMLSMKSITPTTATNIILMAFNEDWAVNSQNVYDPCEALGTQWTHGATATVSSTHVHNGTNAIKIDNQAGAGSYAYLTPWTNPVRSAGKVGVSAWTYATQIAARGCAMVVADGPAGSGNTRCNTVVDATPFRAIWYNGTAYQDATTGLIAGINAWYKLTDYFSVPGNSGKILVNDAVSQTAQTQYGAGNNPKVVEWFAASAVSGGALDTWWIDDVQVHQYLPAIPTIVVGAELASLGVSISPAAWAIATYPVAPTLTLSMASAAVVIATFPVTTTVIPGGITVGMSAAAMGITTNPVTTTWTAPGATTAFRQHANLSLSTLAAAYTAGAGSVQVQVGDGGKFGTPSPSHPLAVVVSQVATAFTPKMDKTNSTIYLVAGVVGDTLTLTATEGTTDRNYALGDYLFCSPTAADLDAMATAINALEARSAAIPSPGGHAGQYLGTDGTSMSWSVVPLSIGQPITGGAAYENGLLFVDASGNLGCEPTGLWYDQTGGILHVPSLQGEGSQINNLNATQLLLGTVPAARLPTTGLTITQHTGAIVVPAGTSGTITCNLALGDYFAPAALTGATTFAFSNPPASGKQAFVLEVIPGGFAITWPATVAWPGGTAPTPTATAGKVDLYGFVYNASAAKYRGAVISQNS